MSKCKKYGELVLPDENGNCSLCGGEIDIYGDCLYQCAEERDEYKSLEANKWHAWMNFLEHLEQSEYKMVYRSIRSIEKLIFKK